MQENHNSQPLSDLTVIDLTHGISGPYCTKLLADFGADVIKVERPGAGDYARTLGPFPRDVPHPEKSGIFLFLNTNKRSVALDLKTAEGVEALKELVKRADILIESFKPGTMDDLGLGYDALHELNPDLIYTSVSNFGQTGPYRDYLGSELTLYAMGGRMTASGLPDMYPLKLGGNHVQFQAGNNAAMASLFAWYGRKYQGLGGQQVDVSIFESQMASINGRLLGLVTYQYTGDRGRRLGGIRQGYPSGPYPCGDGYIHVSGGGQRWPLAVATLGMPELLEDPRFAPPLGQLDLDAREEFEMTIWLPWLLERTQQQVVEEGQANGLLITPILTLDKVVENPQMDARGYFREIEHPVAGVFRYPGAPVYTNDGWWTIRRPAPTLGQHNSEVLSGELGYSEEAVSRMTGAGGAATTGRDAAASAQFNRTASSSRRLSGGGKKPLPLEGVRITDMTVIYAGPYATMFLADMGAEVIRVESLNQLPATSRGQFARPTKESQARAAFSPYPDRDPGKRPWNRFGGFTQHSRNKHGISLDLTREGGLEAFGRLIEKSDIFIENNAVGSMDRLGVSWPTVSQWNPRLIMISATGFGQTGPWNYFRGIGSQFEAATGHASVTGYPNMDAEGIPGSVASDASTGVTLAIAATMALHQREKTGRGVRLDVALGENFMPHLGELFMDYTINGRVASSPGNRDPWFVQGAYPCAGDDEWIAISIGRMEQWHTLSRLMGRPELVEDQRFEDMDSLRANHDEVDRIIGSWTSDQDPIELFHRLQKEGVIAGALMHEIHAFNDPHLKEREFFVSVTAPEIGTHLYPSTTFKMSQTPFEVRKPPVRLGEDNDYVYRDVLGLTEVEYDRLKAAGQIGMDYAPHVV